MDSLSELPNELLETIFKYSILRHIIIMKQVSKFFNDYMVDTQEEFHYNSLNKCNTIDILNNRNLLFTKYTRDKTFLIDSLDEDEKDIQFELCDGEIIICHFKFELSNYSPGIIIVTMNEYLAYNVYEFCAEVGSHEYSDYDDNDINISRLVSKSKFNHLNEIDVVSRSYEEFVYGKTNSLNHYSIFASEIVRYNSWNHSYSIFASKTVRDHIINSVLSDTINPSHLLTHSLEFKSD